MGMNTLIEEQRSRGPESRGIVFQVVDPKLRELRKRLGKGRERNIFVTRAADLDLSQYKVFDGDVVDSAILTSPAGAERLLARGPPARGHYRGWGRRHGRPCSSGSPAAPGTGIEYLLCEGGPTLYGNLARADLIDEKFMTVSPIETGQVVPPEQERTPAEQSVPHAAAAHRVRRSRIHPRYNDALDLAELPQGGRSSIQPIPQKTCFRSGYAIERVINRLWASFSR